MLRAGGLPLRFSVFGFTVRLNASFGFTCGLAAKFLQMAHT